MGEMPYKSYTLHSLQFHDQVDTQRLVLALFRAPSSQFGFWTRFPSLIVGVGERVGQTEELWNV